ncbi:MAG: mechanosensitive ion channel [Bacteriovorax sp.]|nr:mechanosensitive ion channel [Bacteriovorax sp.]
MRAQFIPVSKIQHLIQLEPFIVLWILLPFAFLFYKIFLKKITDKRHANLRNRFSLTFYYLLITTVISAAHWVIIQYAPESNNEFTFIKFSSYLSLFALCFGIISVVKLSQIYVYLYLFLMNMSVGVPRLLANMFTLIFTLVIVSWVAADVFGIQLAAVLATSAVFSLVLGLALQDTLGNLFSGVALQIDRPFAIGDWIEIHSGSEKWTGQVQEVSWRATTLLGFSDELILIPNRLIAQGQLINFSHLQRPARLNHVFRFRFDVSIPLAKKALLEGLANIPEILADPAPRTLITEVTESWITIKVFYSLKDYGTKFRTGDVVIAQIMDCTRKHGLVLATPLLNLSHQQNEEI